MGLGEFKAMEDDDDLRSAFKKMRDQFRDGAADELRSGSWLGQTVQWVLQQYSTQVNAEYLRKKYPGAGPVNQAAKAVSLASKHAAVVGGMSAAAVTGLELGAVAAGPWGVLAIPAGATVVLADVSMTTRIQLRTTYDLSALYGAPLAADDAEDCYLIFLASMGAKLGEAAGEVAMNVGPKVVAFNVRRMLRAGLRAALVEIVKRIGGTALAKKLTERVLMRVLVPGISIPVGAGLNYWFVRSICRTANHKMRRRGAAVRPLVRLFREASELPRETAVKALVTVMQSPGAAKGWEEGQLDALRHTQSALVLSDDTISGLEDWFDKKPEDVVSTLPPMNAEAGGALVEYLTTAAALATLNDSDGIYASAIGTIARGVGAPFEPSSIAKIRKSLE